MTPMLLTMGLLGTAPAQAVSPPKRQVPPSVLAEVQQLESRFELALAEDCGPDLCASAGCAYVDHAVADQPRSRSLPGFSDEMGPGSVDSQAWLTRASCTFAHEASVEPGVAQALTQRLQARLSGQWAVVSVSRKALQPLPDPLVAPDEPAEDVVEVVEPEAPPPLTAAVAGRELWGALLPHFFWMVGVLLGTAALATLIWSWRRVGRLSAEDELLLGQMAAEAGTPPAPEAVEVEPDAAAPQRDIAWAVEQARLWQERLDAFDPEAPDPAVHALLRHLLRSGHVELLAEAALRFPDSLPQAFPEGGDLAQAKLDLAQAIERADPEARLDDVAFFTAWSRHALAARLASQPDAAVVRRLRDDFGAAGLSGLLDTAPIRTSALLFALSPPAMRQEVARLVPASTAEALCAALLRSNRMSPDEATAVFQALDGGDATQAPAPGGAISDRGTPVPAADALSVLLPRLPASSRAALAQDTLRRFAGSLPGWMRGVLTPDLLAAIPSEALGDLLLGVPVDGLAAWLDTLSAPDHDRMWQPMPASLRAAVDAAALPVAPAAQAELAAQGRAALSAGLLQQLGRLGWPFEDAWAPRAVEVG